MSLLLFTVFACCLRYSDTLRYEREFGKLPYFVNRNKIRCDIKLEKKKQFHKFVNENFACYYFDYAIIE